MRIICVALVVVAAGCTRHNPNAGNDLAVALPDLAAGVDLGGGGGRDLAGCQGPADCPPGEACNPTTGICSTSCAGGLVCHGGCCDGQHCTSGDVAGACGRNGTACVACSGATPICSDGRCVARCNLVSAMCPLNSCCAADNACAATSGATCPISGGCIDCLLASTGHACTAGACGCNGAADCPSGTACNVTTHTCSPTCGSGPSYSDCSDGCCDPNSGTCKAGSAADACDVGNAMCSSCAGNANGTTCVFVPGGPNKCGCNSPADCGDQRACNLMTHQCTTACGPTSPCKNGCCDNGTCAPGNLDAKCGALGGACLDCSTASTGHLCLGGKFCGCSMPGTSECPVGTCDVGTKLCSSPCGVGLSCTESCCVGGTGTCATPTPVTCGTMGNCVSCAASPLGHACVGGTGCGCNTSADCPVGQACDQSTKTCGAACTANRPCNSGCCAGGSCVSGTGDTACGSGGVCADCSNSDVGHRCAAGRCGCAVAADCPTGTSCNTTTHACEAACGGGNHSGCNGGCCDAGRGYCTPGTADWACGGGGGTCAVCANATPRCNAGACGP